MPKILNTPPVTEPISLAEAKAHLRVMHTDEDTFINTLITAARNTVEQRYDLALMAQGWSVFADQWPIQGVFNLPLHPVSSIIDIKIYGDDDVAATLDPAHYFLESASKPARLVMRNGRVFPTPARRVNGIEIKLTAGFVSVPIVIKQALLIILADLYASRGDVDGGQLPLAACDLLAPYRQVRLA
jgi:uncharacterized phiE125 gp8 family phage protein